ncbi:MAG: hypothetical protein M1816_008175 [Peltula sp. TS41687]|nr:MAG: hypothetical protein M1816_008175 [Peltula sp. TS41687]
MASAHHYNPELNQVESESEFHIVMANHSLSDHTPLLNESAFQNEQSKKLFEAIDELRRCGANHDIDLPELVIVGDQSAGKSSLLQSLTDIPFPIAGRLCTRFPTRIVSRRTISQDESYRVSLEKGLPCGFAISGSAREQYPSFTQSRRILTPDDFKDLIKRASELLLPKLAQKETAETITESRSNFSSDVLRIEIAGPDRSHFSIIDVPGVFQSRTKDLTEEEKDGVRRMVSSYMESPHSIIICVASGTNDLANQAAFDMALKHDKTGERTVGVITKCDATQHVEQAKLAQNKEKHLRHGWFVVRNRTPEEVAQSISATERAEREARFFASAPWTRLERERCGTAAVAEYLTKLLSKSIEETFPTLLRTIEDLQASKAAQLDRLGPPRKTLEDKRAYLAKLAQDFRSLALPALRGRYDKIPHGMRLRRVIRDANDSFTVQMKTSGHSAPFMEIPKLMNFQTPGIPQTELSNVHAPATSKTPFLATTTFDPGLPQTNLSYVQASGIPETPFRATIALESERRHFQRDFDEPVAQFQTITTMPEYQKHSVEEIRLRDYLQGRKSAVEERQGPVSSGIIDGTTTNLSGGPSGGSFGLFDTKESGASPAKHEEYYLNKSSSGFGSNGLFGGTNSSAASAGIISNRLQNQTSDAPSPRSGGLDASTSTRIMGVGSKTPVASTNLFHTTRMTNGSFIVSDEHKKTPLFSTDRSSAKIYQWIRDGIRSTRGTELQGTLNPDVLPILFHKQAENWKKLSHDHLNLVTESALATTMQMIDTLCTDSYTQEKIQMKIRQANEDAKSRGMTLLSGHLENILHKHLQTNNSGFEEKIKEARLLRFQNALRRYQTRLNRFQSFGIGSGTKPDDVFWIDSRDTAALFDELHISNQQNLEDEIHDTLKAYYEIARENFVEFVTQVVIERYLDDDQGPVLSFSPVYVGKLSDTEVEALAAETESVIREREEMEATLQRLAHAKKIALKYS